MASDHVTVAALGRPFKLGMLYDARRDQLIEGSTLWDPNTLERMTARKPQQYSNFDITESDSTEVKTSLLEVEASLSASVLCGLLEAKGSGQYLHETQEFKNQCRVTFHYKATTHFEQLQLTSDDCEKLQDRSVLESGLATHVVTGIEYGGHTFFVFDTPKQQSLSGNISVGLVTDAQDILDELTDFQIRCNDCLSVDAVGKFPQLKQSLLTFQNLCRCYHSELQRQMADVCPAIREGKVHENVLRRVFDQRINSPFSHDKLEQWMEHKEREINVVESMLEIMKDVPVLSTQAELDAKQRRTTDAHSQTPERATSLQPTQHQLHRGLQLGTSDNLTASYTEDSSTES
ncbi:hypothetical protein WMY93_033393 [Mugilogobius chulae]|uniref:Stonustoxin-like helical domain-containing protein n=1 Tax=Mugilogobius chulae TaxID=88201 RepID=A0AAW0MNY5_9GOBI